jgi:phenylalanyl-tRNA synthetase alpha chain
MPKLNATKQLYLINSYQTEATAVVVNITTVGTKTQLILDQTICIPEENTSLKSQGTITSETGSMKLTSITRSDQYIYHAGNITGEFQVGQSVTLSLDWATRQDHLQRFTASLLIEEAVKTIKPELHGVNVVYDSKLDSYLELNGFLDASVKNELETWITRAIDQDLPINSKVLTAKEIHSEHLFIPNLPPKTKQYRVVSIGDGNPIFNEYPHVKSTKEAWPISITQYTYNEGRARIHYQVNPPKTNQGAKTAPAQPKITPESTSSYSLSEFENTLTKVHETATADQGQPDFATTYLSKKGIFNQQAKLITKLAPTDRAQAGKLLNQLKTQLETLATTSSQTKTTDSTWIDLTMPGIPPKQGHLHLITQAIDEIETIFARLGFVLRRYPEIETDWYYAEGLNIPKDHPARDDQETFYISDSVVLTAHTSNGQLREMELLKNPPIKMINIGKTYRRQASHTHSPMFHQFEGLLIDENITMTHLVGVSNYFAKNYFGSDRKIRLRPHHFQFTEPSFEVDINCQICKGTGSIGKVRCKVCKGGWLELGGAGMVHPQVLINGGIDPNRYSGFAFGWGIERVIMMKHQVTDNLRELYTDNLAFLQQT